MKERITNRLSYLGGGVGVALFAIFGLLPGSFLGGVLGLNVAGVLFGSPVMPSMLSRIIVAAGMLTGVMVTGLIFVTAGATLGWIAGTVIEVVTKTGREAEEKGSARA